MDKVMAQDLKLPAKCVLSKKDFSGSLAKEQPLPQWCNGVIKALKFIDKRSLNTAQKEELKQLSEILSGFTSVAKAKKQFDMSGGNYQYNAFEFKRLLTTYLGNTIYEMRFAGADSGDEASSPYDLDQLNEELQGFVDFALSNNQPEIIKQLDEVINVLEHSMGKAYFEQNTGFFWGLLETRSYMRLKARRAQLNFEHGAVDNAISDLQELLLLNPNDNQANRYPLANYFVLTKRWHDLEQLLKDYEEQSLFMLSVDTLACYALTGASEQSNELKRQLKQSNKHFEAYITGRKKAPTGPTLGYSVGDKTEVFCYLELAGKEVWRSVDGALFWLRQQ